MAALAAAAAAAVSESLLVRSHHASAALPFNHRQQRVFFPLCSAARRSVHRPVSNIPRIFSHFTAGAAYMVNNFVQKKSGHHLDTLGIITVYDRQ